MLVYFSLVKIPFLFKILFEYQTSTQALLGTCYYLFYGIILHLSVITFESSGEFFIYTKQKKPNSKWLK